MASLRIVNTGLSYVGDPETSDLFIDGIAAELILNAFGGGPTEFLDGIEGTNWRITAAGGTFRISWPVVYLHGRPVRYNQRIRVVSKCTGILSIVYLDE